MEPKSTMTQLKRLIGKKWNDPELQADLPTLNYALEEGPDNTPVVRVNVLGEQRLLRPEQLMAALLSELRNIAEKDQGTKVTDCVISIPMFFTEAQRRAMLDAAHIVGLNVLRLIHETTATALAYGIYKTDLPADKPMNVAFVDAGNSSLQVNWLELAVLPTTWPEAADAARPVHRSLSLPSPRRASRCWVWDMTAALGGATLMRCCSITCVTSSRPSTRSTSAPTRARRCACASSARRRVVTPSCWGLCPAWSGCLRLLCSCAAFRLAEDCCCVAGEESAFV